MTLPNKVRIVEVSPRDGLQNEPGWVATQDKIKFIEQLAATGLQHIEATSFVSAKKIPQLKDHCEVMQSIHQTHNCKFSVLVPNMRGFDNAIACGSQEIALFAACSETFSEKNINCSIAESFERFIPIMPLAKQHNIKVRGYLSCCFDCPYEGVIKSNMVVQLAKQLIALGCYEVSIGDTTGTATAERTKQLFNKLIAAIDADKIAGHFHDTYGQALANIYACLQLGINNFDSSVSGLGGCPYAKGASGNVATEDLVYMLHGCGVETGLNLDGLIACGQFIDEILQRKTESKVSRVKQQS